MKKRKIAVIASSRATYGYKRKLIGMINESPCLELQLIVTGMHLMKKYGYSINEIKADNFPIAAKVDIGLEGDTPVEWTRSIGKEIQGLSSVFEKNVPDIVLITGDRAEMFAATVTAVYMGIPVAHIQAGDVSGHIDGSARHAITKLSHIHFASCSDSANRVKRIGEEPWRIFNVGAPQLDEIIHAPKISKKKLSKIFKVDFNKPVILVIQHPVLVEVNKAYAQMKETMDAIKATEMQTIIVYPNLDAGGAKIIKAIKEYKNGLPFRAYENINRQHFISLLKQVSVIVGNSSCGILEAPSFKLPSLNIGNRQRGRMQTSNVINVGYDSREIKEGIEKAVYDKKFKRVLKQCINPYGDGQSSARIKEILENIKINDALLDKKITY